MRIRSQSNNKPPPKASPYQRTRQGSQTASAAAIVKARLAARPPGLSPFRSPSAIGRPSQPETRVKRAKAPMVRWASVGSSVENSVASSHQ